jgi:hypothetical protein
LTAHVRVFKDERFHHIVVRGRDMLFDVLPCVHVDAVVCAEHIGQDRGVDVLSEVAAHSPRVLRLLVVADHRRTASSAWMPAASAVVSHTSFGEIERLLRHVA